MPKLVIGEERLTYELTERGVSEYPTGSRGPFWKKLAVRKVSERVPA